MRVKKQKQLRRHVSFYKTCFGFREPFKVLVDGTFVHYSLTQKLGALQDSISHILGAPAKPLVTRCVVAELKKLGEAYSGTALAARRLDLIRCEHEPFLPAGECLTSLVGSHNEEHYFVATQDLDLRKRLRKVHGGALLYANNTSIVLEPPSDTQKQYAKMGEVERNRLSEREKHLLKLRQEKLEGEAKADDVAADGKQRKNVKKNHNPLGVADRPVFKRKRVKGPNPLSCKKKKTNKGEQKNTEQKSAATAGGAETPEKKKKSRQRRKKSSEEKGPEQSSISAE
jgi:U3 small nucleolar RNA-associated protein 23